MPRLGKYELGKTIGRGNFAKVIAGVDVTTDRPVAVKVIEKSGMAQEKWEGQLKREVGIMRRLRHPNIVSLEDVLQSKSRYYLVMELIAGGELFARLVESRRFSEDVARTYFQQLCSALRHCHKRGIAHRDLKPENLLVSKDGSTLKITDFGLSACQLKEDILQTVCGTPHYVAPEVIKDQYDPQSGALKPKSARAADHGYNGFKADTWSVGVILYAMLAGHLPFDDRRLVCLFKKVEEGKYTVPSHFPPQVVDLLEHILVLDINERYTLDQVILHSWVQTNLDTAMFSESKGKDGDSESVAWSVVSVNTKLVAHPDVGRTSNETQEVNVPIPPTRKLPAAPAVEASPPPESSPNPAADSEENSRRSSGKNQNLAVTRSNGNLNPNLATGSPLRTLGGTPLLGDLIKDEDATELSNCVMTTKPPGETLTELCDILENKLGATLTQKSDPSSGSKLQIKGQLDHAGDAFKFVLVVSRNTSGGGGSSLVEIKPMHQKGPKYIEAFQKQLLDAAEQSALVQAQCSLPALSSSPSVVQQAGGQGSPSGSSPSAAISSRNSSKPNVKVLNVADQVLSIHLDPP